MNDETFFLVTSLPRTGTTSIAKMAQICGIKTIHVLNQNFQEAISQGYRFFSNTPFYSPEFLCGMLETTKLKFKFLYSHRSEEKWLNSMNELRKIWLPTEKMERKIHLMDKMCYEHMYPPKIHYEIISQVSKFYGIEMLDYKFSDGWEPFCKFVKKPVPESDLPFINKNGSVTKFE